jgi:hypothetical protein
MLYDQLLSHIDVSEDLRRWFLNQECTLFRYRFEGELRKDKEEYIIHHKLGYEPVRIKKLLYKIPNKSIEIMGVFFVVVRYQRKKSIMKSR